VVAVNTDNAVSTYQLLTFVTVEVCFLGRVFEAEQSLLERRDEGGHVSRQSVKVDDLVGAEVIPLLVGLLAALAHKPTSAAEASCLAFLTLVAQWLVTGGHLLEGVLDVKEIVHVKGSLETWNSAPWQIRLLATLRAREATSLRPLTYQRSETMLTKHVKTLEQLGLCVGLQTYPTGDLVLDLLESFLGSSGGFGSHGSVSSAADKLERGSSED
jgi:hypothetical protein